MERRGVWFSISCLGRWQSEWRQPETGLTLGLGTCESSDLGQLAICEPECPRLCIREGDACFTDCARIRDNVVGSLCSVRGRCSVNGRSEFHRWSEGPETSIFGCAVEVMGKSLNSLDLFTHLENGGRGGDPIA